VFYQHPKGVRALAAVPAWTLADAILTQIRCTGIAYADFRSKYAAWISHLLLWGTFAGAILAQIRCTGIAYADFCFKSTAQTSHLLRYADLRFNVASNPNSLRTNNEKTVWISSIVQWL